MDPHGHDPQSHYRRFDHPQSSRRPDSVPGLQDGIGGVLAGEQWARSREMLDAELRNLDGVN